MNNGDDLSSSNTSKLILEDRERFVIETFAGTISGVISQYRDGDRKAYNTNIKIMTTENFLNGRRALLSGIMKFSINTCYQIQDHR